MLNLVLVWLQPFHLTSASSLSHQLVVDLAVEHPVEGSIVLQAGKHKLAQLSVAVREGSCGTDGQAFSKAISHWGREGGG